MKKAISLFLVILMMVAALPALASSPVEITWACWGAVEESTKPAFDAMVADFEAKNPDIKVNVVGYPYNNVQEQLLIQAAGNTPPDVAQCAPIWVASLVEMDALVPMDELFSQEVYDDFAPSACEGTTIGGKRMSIPWNINPVCAFVNTALLKQAGYDTLPQSWGEMVEMSRKVAALGNTADGNKIYGMTISSKLLFGAGYFFLLDVWQNGGEFVDADGKVVFNSPETVAAYEEAAQLMADGVVAPGLEVKENRNLFALGQAAFHFDLPAIVKLMKETSPKGEAFGDDFTIMAIPGKDAPNGISFSSDHHMVVFKDSKNKEAAAKFAEYITGLDGITTYTNNGVTVFPARESAKANPFYSTLDEKGAAFFASLPYCRGLPVQSSAFKEACEAIVGGLQRVAINNEDATTVVAETDAKIKELYKQ